MLSRLKKGKSELILNFSKLVLQLKHQKSKKDLFLIRNSNCKKIDQFMNSGGIVLTIRLFLYRSTLYLSVIQIMLQQQHVCLKTSTSGVSNMRPAKCVDAHLKN